MTLRGVSPSYYEHKAKSQVKTPAQQLAEALSDPWIICIADGEQSVRAKPGFIPVEQYGAGLKPLRFANGEYEIGMVGNCRYVAQP